MSEMVYMPTFRDYAEILDEGVSGGYHYVIVSYGSHPCAYVKIPEGHPCYGLDYMKIFVTCHGGLTFSHMGLQVLGEERRPGFWIGWDYSHAGDHLEMPNLVLSGKKWTLAEIKAEVERVTWQLAGHAGGAMLDD